MKILSGKVVSVKSQNTIIVEVVRQRVDPVYGKIVKKSKRYKTDCSIKDISLGDAVKIAPVRPISKDKHFRFAGKVVSKMKGGKK